MPACSTCLLGPVTKGERLGLRQNGEVPCSWNVVPQKVLQTASTRGGQHTRKAISFSDVQVV